MTYIHDFGNGLVRYYGPKHKIPPNTSSVSVHADDLTHVWHQIILPLLYQSAHNVIINQNVLLCKSLLLGYGL